MLEASLSRRSQHLGEADTAISYRFRTPWLGLNQENHARYEVGPDLDAQRALLERTLVGNCLSLAKGLGHWVQARVAADCRGLRPVQAGLKGVAMVGFIGSFRVNFHIPRHAGIGKSVSRGFGTAEPILEHPATLNRNITC